MQLTHHDFMKSIFRTNLTGTRQDVTEVRHGRSLTVAVPKQGAVWPAIILLLTIASPVFAQRELSGAAETRLALEKLEVTGSVLMIAAHPDDENTALLAYFARGRKVRTGYLSLTRGEGGQRGKTIVDG